MPSERQTLIDLLIAKDLQEAAASIVKWAPTTYQPADVLTKAMPVPSVLALLLEKGLCALVQTEEDAKAEARRAELRHDQRQRRKQRAKALQAKAALSRSEDASSSTK